VALVELSFSGDGFCSEGSHNAPNDKRRPRVERAGSPFWGIFENGGA
jgi:hypothetical protein